MYQGYIRTGNEKEDAKAFCALASSYIYAPRDIFETVCILSNVSSVIWQAIDRINWAGFYIYDGERLVLGPFQGEPACFFIKPGRGVCGTAFEKKETVIVPDVEEFPGHIACSSASRSEIVVPILAEDGRCLGVIDIDSPEKGRFSAHEKELLESIAHLLVAQNVFCGYAVTNS